MGDDDLLAEGRQVGQVGQVGQKRDRLAQGMGARRERDQRVR